MTDIVKEKDLLQLCVEYEQLSITEKITIIDCLEKYLYSKRNSLSNVDTLIVSLVLQCTSANQYHFRRVSVRCLAYLSCSDYSDIAISELNKAVLDPSDYVRRDIINICRNNYVSQDLSRGLLSILCKDANYNC